MNDETQNANKDCHFNASPCQGANGTILVVEDEVMLLDLIVSTLEANGFRVLAARDGDAALDVFTRNQSEIDVIMTDMGLPKQSGLEFFRKAKEINPLVQGIVMSGYLESEERNAVRQAGIQIMMDKPFETRQVVKALHTIKQATNERIAGERPRILPEKD